MTTSRPFHPFPFRRPVSLRDLLILLYLGALIPLLVLIGLVVYSLQQRFLMNDLRDRLVGFVAADVGTMEGNDLTRLAVTLGEDLRVLGADVFVQDAQGKPVPPALGTGPWMSDADHRSARDNRESRLLTIPGPTAGSQRLVYLVTILDDRSTVLGSIEASLPLEPVQAELAALRRWLTIILGLAAAVSVLLALGIAWMATRPLSALVQTAARVGQGDLGHRAVLPMISEVRSLAETFNAMLDRIQASLARQERTAEEMRRFAADASHELRSPLAVLSSGSALLEKALERGDRGETGTILGMLRQEIDAMSGLVDNLLFLARLDQAAAGDDNGPVFTSVVPLPLLEEVYERGLLLANGRCLKLDWPAQPIRAVRADREMLRRALNNLVENALKYTPPGKSVYLELEPAHAACRFVVRDEGPGIPEELLPRIFERFYRIDAARTRSGSLSGGLSDRLQPGKDAAQTSAQNQPGTGLGLSIVSAIVQALGGSISVQSRIGSGSTFIVEIPYEYE